MTSRITIGAMLLVAITALVTTKAVSQEPPSPEAMAEMMKKMVEAGTPGEQHAFLMKRVGKWTTTYKFWMAGPGSEAMTSTGTAEMKSILGGRWLQETSKGMIMGQPHEGFGLSGYDNFRKQFRTMWFDNMSTTVYAMTGYLDRTGKVLTTYGPMDEPATGEVAKISRFVTTFVSDDEFVLSGYDLRLGDDAKVMEIVYKRVK